jgi:hypothetical protein
MQAPEFWSCAGQREQILNAGKIDCGVRITLVNTAAFNACPNIHAERHVLFRPHTYSEAARQAERLSVTQKNVRCRQTIRRPAMFSAPGMSGYVRRSCLALFSPDPIEVRKRRAARTASTRLT